MLWKYLATGAACLIAGFAARGLLDQDTVRGDAREPGAKNVRSSSRAPAPGAAGSAASRPSSRESVGDAGLGAVWGTAAPEENGRLVVVPAGLLEKLAARHQTMDPNQELFTQDGELESLLQISGREKAALQQAWRDTRRKLRDLEVAKIVHERLPDGSVKIVVPDLSAEVSAIGGGFRTSLAAQLGENRARAFAAARQLDGAFSRPGGETTYEVKVEAAGNGRWRYKMRQQGPGGSKVWVGDNAPRAIRHLTDAANIRSNLNPPEEDDE